MATGMIEKPYTAYTEFSYQLSNASYANFKKVGRIVMGYVRYSIADGAIAPWGLVDIVDLPADFSPIISIECPVTIDRSDCDASLQISPGGHVAFSGRNTGATKTGEILKITVTYISKQ